ncbi:uncharacterized protein [Penaeus vannamei]|uniref:uncharacterized protein n=1 Tax=Penaeus vannamei TaxID=6689 RepID=UPI00387FAFBA
MVERFNATLVTQLAKYCEEDQHDWDEWVPYMLMAYHAVEHEAMGFTPSRLMFGREICLPVYLATRKPLDEGLPVSHTKYVWTLQCRIEETRHRTIQHLKIAGQAMGRWYNEQARDAVYSPGDQVWFHNPCKRPGKSPKLQSPWEGPYTVVERISAVTYRITPAGSSRRTKVVHVDRLWRHSGKGVFTWGPRVSDHDSNSDIVGVTARRIVTVTLVW